MLIINAKVQGFDNATQEFVDLESYPLRLEHSLASLSKWEFEHLKPFLGDEPKTNEETLSYIRCMAVDENVPDEIWERLKGDDYQKINDYINYKATATWFNEPKQGGPSREVVTAELLYYLMTALNIDWQAQYWHLNKLLTLIKVCNIKNSPPKKQSRREAIAHTRALNAQRRAQMGQ